MKTTHEQKINNMRIAAGIAGFGFSHEQLDLLVSLYDLVQKKKGQTDVDSIVSVEFAVKKRTEEKRKKKLIEKIK